VRLRRIEDLFAPWDLACVVASAEKPGAFPILSWITWDRPVPDGGLDSSIEWWHAASEAERELLLSQLGTSAVSEARVRVLAREIHRDNRVAERYVLAPIDGWIAYEAPLEEPGWHLSTLFVRDGERLVLAELKVFPGTDRSVIRPRTTWQESASAVNSGYLRSLGWELAGQWSGDIAGQDCGGITARMLRAELRLSPIQQRVAYLTSQAAELTFQLEPDFGALDRPVATGGRSPSNVSLAMWASRYVEALSVTRSPNKTVGERHGLTASQVRDRVNRARKAGLLTTGGGRGRQGGELTEKALQILSREGDKRKDLG